MNFALGFETGPTLSLDMDNDQLADVWETANGLNPADSVGDHGAGGDQDGDGRTNIEEFITGTNPNGGDTYKPVPSKVTAGFKIAFPTLLDRTYRTYYSDDLGTWHEFGDLLIGTGMVVEVTDDGTTSNPHPNTRARRFYKVEVSLTNP